MFRQTQISEVASIEPPAPAANDKRVFALASQDAKCAPDSGKLHRPLQSVIPLSRKMNLALIDPFQLAQDYPDALTNDLRMYTIFYIELRPSNHFQTVAMLQHSGSIARATTLRLDGLMARSLFGTAKRMSQPVLRTSETHQVQDGNWHETAWTFQAGKASMLTGRLRGLTAVVRFNL